ncbi:MAG: hypothetical protein MK319_08930 [Pseudomonadales bacterium]|jgi:pimeloyl-ACP methyl ester carboxylesterase|nr:hypothetical protein [Pseudomonadales bacterium]
MPNSNLLVPGTGGITLMDNTGKDIGWPVMMRLRGIIHGLSGQSDQHLGELISMEHRPGQIAPVKTSLLPGTSLAPGHVLDVAYNQMKPGFNHFLYDWRADLRYSAAQLKDFIVQRRPNNGKWNLIGHSQGGLIIILASNMFASTTEFADFVTTATLVAAPIAGTLNTAEAFILGNNAGQRLAPVMRHAIRTWPGIYQMLPAWQSVLRADGSVAAASRQLNQSGGWPGLGDIQSDLLLRAREVQQDLQNPIGNMDGVDVRFYFAQNRKTNSSIRRPSSGPMLWDPVATENGDTLVPYRTTRVQNGGGRLLPSHPSSPPPVSHTR